MICLSGHLYHDLIIMSKSIKIFEFYQILFKEPFTNNIRSSKIQIKLYLDIYKLISILRFLQNSS